MPTPTKPVWVIRWKPGPGSSVPDICISWLKCPFACHLGLSGVFSWDAALLPHWTDTQANAGVPQDRPGSFISENERRRCRGAPQMGMVGHARPVISLHNQARFFMKTMHDWVPFWKRTTAEMQTKHCNVTQCHLVRPWI